MNIKALSFKGTRKTNQDSLLAGNCVYTNMIAFSSEAETDEDICVFAVCDGVGGESLGETSSRIAIQTVAENLSNRININSDRETIDTCVFEAIEKAQSRISDELTKKNAIGGTTISILVFYGDRFVTYNIGDSPIYIIRGKELIRLSKPHTVAEQKRDCGYSEKQIDEIDHHSLTQCLGSYGYSNISIFESYCATNDKFVVMSDGLELLGPKKMKKMLLKENFNINNKDLNMLNDNVSVIIIKK